MFPQFGRTERWLNLSAAEPIEVVRSLCRQNFSHYNSAMMAKLTGHVWSFDELFETILGPQ